jgi:hypothetical protein
MISAAIVSTGVDEQVRCAAVNAAAQLSRDGQDSHGFYVIEVASASADK